MSVRAQVIITLPSLRKMLMEDVAWASDHCPKQACISIAGQRVAGIRYASVYLSTAQCGLGHELKKSPTKQELHTYARLR